MNKKLTIRLFINMQEPLAGAGGHACLGVQNERWITKGHGMMMSGFRMKNELANMKIND